MRRTYFTLLLALLVVCAQQAGLVHEIGHGLPGGATDTRASVSISQSQDPGPSGQITYCDKCFEFAHVAGAAFGIPVAAQFALAVTERALGSRIAEIPADAPISRSRGPPTFL